MTTRATTWMLASVAMVAAAGCGRKDASRARATGAEDTAVAAELRQAADTAAYREAADVAMRDIPDSTLPMPPRRTMVAHGARQPAPRTAVATPSTSPSMTPSMTPSTSPATRPPVTARAPVAMRPAPPSDVRPSVPAPAASVSRSCDSPAMPDQRRCLMAYLARSDEGLDRVYQARIRQLRDEAGTPAGAPEPESVQRLRVAQRAWLVYRDTECRNRNRGREGPLWAPTRAQCLGEFSQARAQELSR